MSVRDTSIAVAVLLAIGGTPSGPARSDVFVLKSGGRVVGELVETETSGRAADKEVVTIQGLDGVQVTLAKSLVKQWIRQKPAEVEYEKVRSRYADTAEAQWELAEWCRERGLTAQRESHLKRIVDLDPNHEKARLGLGQTRIGGQWTTQEEVMRKQGRVLYKGRWRLPQEVELEQEKHQIDVVEKEWKKKLKLWRQWFGTSKEIAGRESIRAIREPAAVRALGDALQEDASPAARLLYVNTLAQIGTPEAKIQLAIASIDDSVEEVRLTCLDHLKKEKNPDVVKYYSRKLRDKENEVINRAAIGLREMGDKSAIGPLIDALVTTHKKKVGSGNPGQISSTFGMRGSPGGGLSVGGGPQIVSYQVQNRAVLDALVALSGGANFLFNVAEWKTWYAAQRKSQFIDARRD